MLKIAILHGAAAAINPVIKNLASAEEYTFEMICCDNGLQPDALLQYDVVINALGKYFEETTAPALTAYDRSGGILIHLAPDALTVPYVFRDGEVIELPKQVDLLRSMSTVDFYIPVEADPAQCTVEAGQPVSAALADLLKNCSDLADFRSAAYNLTRTDERKDPETEPALFPRGRLTPLVTLRQADGHVAAVPVMQSFHPGDAAAVWFNFTSEAFWSNPKTAEVLLNFVLALAEEYYSLDIEAQYGRFVPGENAIVNLRVRALSKKCSGAAVKLELLKKNGYSFAEAESTSLRTWEEHLPVGKTVPVCLGELPEGAYIVRAALGDKTVRQNSFFVLSDETIMAASAAFPRMTVNREVSTEYHTQNGKTVAVHGTTYFVQDTYRSCFFHLNPELATAELAMLQNDGFNVLRTGQWTNKLAFYTPDGSVDDRVVRNMQAFFFVAMQYGMTVQFVLGTEEMNDWAPTLSTLHNPMLQEKCMRVFTRFFTEFADYTNVQMDIINEPSYSRRGAWRTALPSHDPTEKAAWQVWLKKKYNNDLSLLRGKWGACAVRYQSFDEIDLPADEAFWREYNRTTEYTFRVLTADFFLFAAESYAAWDKRIRDLGRELAPNMVVLMGRDESVRVPTEQEEFLAGNIDTINWHQWQQNGIVFTEYMLNKVPDSICCGQELGMYQMENHRGEKRMDPEAIAAMLERKLLYSYGNWVQWQVTNDPYMVQICENTLGIYRADGTETPGMQLCRDLAHAEAAAEEHMGGRDSAESNIIVVHPTSCHYSSDNGLAVESIRTAADLLGYHLKQHFFIALEQTLPYYKAESGKLYLVPSAYTLQDETWALLKELAEAGNTVLITGSVEQDPYYLPKKRLCALDENLYVEPAANVEPSEYGPVSFRRVVGYRDVMHVLDKCTDNSNENKLHVYPVGKGKIYHHPLPLELADDFNHAKALYRSVLVESGLWNESFTITEGAENSAVVVRMQRSDEAIIYTLVNEGRACAVTVKDRETGRSFRCELAAGRGVKLWMTTSGDILSRYVGGSSTLTML